MKFITNPNGTCDAYLLIKSCTEKKTKTGSTYLDIVLGDKDSEIPAKWWDYHGTETFSDGDVVKIRAQKEEYQGHDQLRIMQMRKANEKDPYDPADLVPSSNISGTEIYNYLVEKVNNFENDELKAIVLKIYYEKKTLLIRCPAAKGLHHAKVGGLMEHTLSIVKMADAICDVHKDVNRELLIAGAMLHDVAKTWEFDLTQLGIVSSYSIEGNLVGHLVKGAMYIEKAGEELGTSRKIITLLEHMVLSHHGQPDFGSPIRPMFAEAVILSSLDALDANLYEIDDETSKIPVDTFTGYLRFLDNRKLFNHGLSNNEYGFELEDGEKE